MRRSMFIKCSVLLLGVMAVVAGMSLSAYAASADEINAKVDTRLDEFYEEFPEAKKLSENANGILVFPSVVKAGLVIGGEYGEGALRIGGKTVDYYSTAAASFGLQLGVQAKTVILMFMEGKALADFRDSKGWEIGVDGSVALVEIGTGGSIDSTNIKDPIIGFVFGQKGLMFNLTLEGSKLTKIKR